MASEASRKKAEERAEEFEALCQEYRHAPLVPQAQVVAAFEALCRFVEETRAEGVAEGEKRLSDALQAVGLLSTLAGDVVMDPYNLVGMAQEIVASVEKSYVSSVEVDAKGEVL